MIEIESGLLKLSSIAKRLSQGHNSMTREDFEPGRVDLFVINMALLITRTRCQQYTLKHLMEKTCPKMCQKFTVCFSTKQTLNLKYMPWHYE